MRPKTTPRSSLTDGLSATTGSPTFSDKAGVPSSTSHGKVALDALGTETTISPESKISTTVARKTRDDIGCWISLSESNISSRTQFDI
jgi:hypothetical protein